MSRALELNGIQLKSARRNESDSHLAPGAVRIAFGLNVADVGGWWSALIAEPRVAATNELTRRGMGRHWRLIVPGSGLLRLQWLEGIKQRAERMPNPQS